MDPDLPAALEGLIDPLTRGDARSPLRWTCKSTAVLAEEMRERGRAVSVRSMAFLLQGLGYRLAGQRGGRGDKGHAQRNAQFAYLNARVADFQERCWPVIAVEARRQEWAPPGPGEGGGADEERAVEAGEPGAGGRGWANRDASPLTIEWVAKAIHHWWRHTSPGAYPGEAEVLVAADLGDGDSYRLWSSGLQGLADRLGRPVTLGHLPPGTSKWNRGQQRMVAAHTTSRGPGHLRTRHEVVASILSAAPPANPWPPPGAAGAAATAAAADRRTAAGERAPWPGRWNYTLLPRG
jgi:hypothetical protein